jgi:hypothetical protein
MKSRKKFHRFLVFLALGVSTSFAACSGGGGDEEEPVGDEFKEPEPIDNNQPLPPVTALVCNQGTYLTYDNFGASFLESYCLSCHHSSLPEEDRVGAPTEVNFDTSELAQLWRASILAKAGSDRATMPPNQKVPTQERKDFVDWLNCGAPN